jgi:transposase, IS5 family
MPRRFRPSGRDSFWGDTVYEMAVPQEHFLRQLRGLLDWEEFTKDLVEVYKGKAEEGGVPVHPSIPLRMLLVSYLYDLSERQTEEYVNDSLAAKYFVGLAVHERAMDHSSLTVFKQRVLEKKGQEGFEALFRKVVRLAKEKGIPFGKIQVVDATHSIADVDVQKDKERKDGGAKPRDDDAAWGSKGRRNMKTADGKVVQVNKSFYGFKSHLSVNAESEIVTAVAVTPGNKTDGQQFEELEKRDEAVGVEAEIYAGDKGYDDGDNHELLRSKGKHSALCLKGYRTKLYPTGLWADIKASQEYRDGLKQRYKIEQKNGEAKSRHGLGKCRYVGLAKYALQAYMTATVMNLKRMVVLLCGVSLHGGKPMQLARG